jgi:hypothetical protein
MKAAVKRIIIFCLAIGTHYERAHSGFGTVVRDVLYDGEAWSAICTVGKGIVVAPVFGVEDFFEAGLACSDVRRHQLILAFFSNTVPNLKLCIVCRWVTGNGNVFYMS